MHSIANAARSGEGALCYAMLGDFAPVTHTLCPLCGATLEALRREPGCSRCGKLQPPRSVQLQLQRTRESFDRVAPAASEVRHSMAWHGMA